MANTNRDKGHRLERKVRNDLKTIYPLVRTSREASRMYDNCGIDLVFVPFFIQCKDVQSKKLDFQTLKNSCLSLVKSNFPQDTPIYPYILIHKVARNTTQVTMDYDIFLKLIDGKVDK